MIGGLDVNLGSQRQQALVQRVLAQFNANLAGSQQLNAINASAQAYLPKNIFAPTPVTGGVFSETNRPLDPNTAFGNLPAAPVPSGGHLPTQNYSLLTDVGPGKPFKLPWMGGGTAGRVPAGRVAASNGRLPAGVRPPVGLPRPPLLPEPPVVTGPRPSVPEPPGQSRVPDVMTPPPVVSRPDVPAPPPTTTRPSAPSPTALAQTRGLYKKGVLR